LIEKRQIGRQASPFITKIKMNQDKLSSATRELRIIPSHHATHDPDAQSLLDGLSDILLAAERGDIKAPLERNSIPGNYFFNERNLRVHDGLELAYVNFKIEATGGPSKFLLTMLDEASPED
jgi:hypothetical protein